MTNYGNIEAFKNYLKTGGFMKNCRIIAEA